MRATMPNVTTPGPDCHTIVKTGGTLRRAERRSCQLLQKVSFSDIWPSPARSHVLRAEVCTRDAEKWPRGLIKPGAPSRLLNPKAPGELTTKHRVIISCILKLHRDRPLSLSP